MSGETSPLTVLVLAGQRDGTIDPLAAAAGLSFKALSPVAGRPMIVHTLDAIASCKRVGQILVSINAGSNVEALPEVAGLIAAGRLKVLPARGKLVESVMSALDGAAFPVLIATADSVLITPETIAEIDDTARAGSCDVAVALARKSAVLSVHPDGQRKFYRFADDFYSNCNSYWLGSAAALGPVSLFRSGGQFVKKPMRVVGVLGLGGLFELVRFRFGLGTLDAGFRRLSRRFKLNMRAVIVRDGAAAIDVDAERSLKVAEEIIAARGRAAAA